MARSERGRRKRGERGAPRRGAGLPGAASASQRERRARTSELVAFPATNPNHINALIITKAGYASAVKKGREGEDEKSR
jgi:hypothetical protein